MDEDLIRNIKENIDLVLTNDKQLRRIIKDPSAINLLLNEKR